MAVVRPDELPPEKNKASSYRRLTGRDGGGTKEEKVQIYPVAAPASGSYSILIGLFVGSLPYSNLSPDIGAGSRPTSLRGRLIEPTVGVEGHAGISAADLMTDVTTLYGQRPYAGTGSHHG